MAEIRKTIEGFLSDARASGAIDSYTHSNLREYLASYTLNETHGEANGFRLTLSHLGWVVGAVLLALGLLFLTVEITDEEPGAIAVFFTIYSITLFIAQSFISKRQHLTLLALVLSVVAIALAVAAAICMQEATGKLLYFDEPRKLNSEDNIARYADRISFERWFWYSAVIPAGMLALGGFWLVARRKFLVAWTLIIGGALVVGAEVFYRQTPNSTRLEDFFEPYTIFAGLILYFAGWVLDNKSEINHGYWFNKFGLLSFSTGMWLFYNSSELLFLLACLGVIFLAVFQQRPGGLVFGLTGLVTYAVDFVFDLGSVVLGALILIGIGIFLLWFAARIYRVTDSWMDSLPDWVQRIRPPKRDDPVTFGF